jgi:hypothetical protein
MICCRASQARCGEAAEVTLVCSALLSRWWWVVTHARGHLQALCS